MRGAARSHLLDVLGLGLDLEPREMLIDEVPDAEFLCV